MSNQKNDVQYSENLFTELQDTNITLSTAIRNRNEIRTLLADGKVTWNDLSFTEHDLEGWYKNSVAFFLNSTYTTLATKELSHDENRKICEQILHILNSPHVHWEDLTFSKEDVLSHLVDANQ